MANNTFPKKEKLCSYSHIQQLFSEGKSIKVSPLKMLYTPIKTDCGTPVKVLVSVPKRGIRKAVHRNYIKRIIRESYRLQKELFVKNQKQYAFAFIYLPKEKSSFHQVFEAITQIAILWKGTSD